MLYFDHFKCVEKFCGYVSDEKQKKKLLKFCKLPLLWNFESYLKAFYYLLNLCPKKRDEMAIFLMGTPTTLRYNA